MLILEKHLCWWVRTPTTSINGFGLVGDRDGRQHKTFVLTGDIGTHQHKCGIQTKANKLSACPNGNTLS
jgi:hypothetical protein